MKRLAFLLLILGSFLLAACRGAEQIPLDEVTETAIVVATATTEVAEASPGQESPEESGLKSECTLFSSVPEPSPEYADLFAVTEKDWASGPEDAAVTLIEYGDFQ